MPQIYRCWICGKRCVKMFRNKANILLALMLGNARDTEKKLFSNSLNHMISGCLFIHSDVSPRSKKDTKWMNWVRKRIQQIVSSHKSTVTCFTSLNSTISVFGVFSPGYHLTTKPNIPRTYVERKTRNFWFVNWDSFAYNLEEFETFSLRTALFQCLVMAAE